MEINSSLDLPNDKKIFEAHAMAKVLSEKIDVLPYP